jgi:hypothetical protein
MPRMASASVSRDRRHGSSTRTHARGAADHERSVGTGPDDAKDGSVERLTGQWQTDFSRYQTPGISTPRGFAGARRGGVGKNEAVMNSARRARLFFAGLLLVAVVQLVLSVSSLPPVVASHFGPSGAADGFLPRSAWLVVHLLFLAIPAFLALAVPDIVVRTPPEYVNLPNKEHWLSPAHRDEARDLLRAYFAGFGAGLLAFLMSVLHLVFAANAARGPLDNTTFLIGLAAFFVFTFAWVAALLRRFSRLPTAT